MFTYDFTLPVGPPVAVNAAGTYVRYVSVAPGTTNPRIRLKSSNSDEIELMPGQAVRLNRKSAHFTLRNVDGVSTIEGALLIGDGEMGDSRISGEVLNVDGSYVRALSHQAYSTYQSVAAVAAQLGHLQVWNPAGSGRVFVVHTIRAALTAAGTAELQIRQHNAALASFSAGLLRSKKLDSGTAGGVLMETRSTTNAAPLGNPIVSAVMTQAGVTLSFQDPFIVSPGWGLMAVCGTANMAFSASFEHYFIDL